MMAWEEILINYAKKPHPKEVHLKAQGRKGVTESSPWGLPKVGFCLGSSSSGSGGLSAAPNIFEEKCEALTVGKKAPRSSC